VSKEIKRQSFSQFHWILFQTVEGRIRQAEVTELTSETYNSYWGYQDGKKRNARVKTIEEPILMLNHYFKINDHSNLNSSVMVQFGKIGNSNLDYQNANSPDPTYFENYLVIIVPCMARRGEYSGAFTPDNENAESRLQFLANLKLIGIPCIRPQNR
jgi:hypothetical protein